MQKYNPHYAQRDMIICGNVIIKKITSKVFLVCSKYKFFSEYFMKKKMLQEFFVLNEWKIKNNKKEPEKYFFKEGKFLLCFLVNFLLPFIISLQGIGPFEKFTK